MRLYYVYIMASIQRVLYVGMTGAFERRIAEHRAHAYPQSFTSRYNVTRLVYFEEYTRVADALEREKQLKRWKHSKKAALIARLNPEWDDLAAPQPTRIPRLRSG